MVSGKKSVIAGLIEFGLKISGYKKRVIEKAKNPSRSTKPFTPIRIKSRYQASVDILDQRIIATLNPKNPSGNKHIIFFHGGGYVFEITIGHWLFIENLHNLLSLISITSVASLHLDIILPIGISFYTFQTMT